MCREGEVQRYNRSLGEIVMANGSKIKMLSADEPDRARGRGFHAVWCDEMSSWRYPATWYETLLPAVTMADRHRFVVTTTPKRNELTRALLARAEAEPDKVRLVRGRTLDNRANLGAGVVEELERQMTAHQVRQELYGELVDDVEGALWTLDLVERSRVRAVPDLDRVVVGVDPAATSGPNADQTGIVVVGRRGDDAYVLDDRTLRAGPDGWARAAILAYEDHEADVIVAEVNQGGEMVTQVLRTIDSGVRIRTVHASRGKQVRAEPVVARYEQGHVHHVGVLADLEDQLCSWVPGQGASPDRLDALVWACTELFPAKRKMKLLV